MKTRLVIDGNSVYEIDEECLACSQKREQERQTVKKQTADRASKKNNKPQ